MIFRKKSKRSAKTDTHVSVILRRQIPIRFDEAPRSWLGGLPMMPRLTKWPRDAEGAPLHFIAQIACADLPPNLWNGLGPRSGWLFLFVETLKFEDCAEGGIVQVLHVNRLGSEREPPEDAPMVRHVMSDYIYREEVENRHGVPKFWRKWPVDIVVQEYTFDDSEQGEWGPPQMSAEELYGAPVSEWGIARDVKMDIEHPLTWRGTLYFVEQLLRHLEPAKYRKDFLGLGGLLGAPESDRAEFNKEYNRRLSAKGVRGLLRAEDIAVSNQIEAELAAERSTGWMAGFYSTLDKAMEDLKQEKDEIQQEIDAGGEQLADKLDNLKKGLEYNKERVEFMRKSYAFYDDLFAGYDGPEGEQRFASEIKALGEAHLARGERLRKKLLKWLSHILSQDLNAPILDEDWQKIISLFDTGKSDVWFSGLNKSKLPATPLTERYLEMAIREDLLDLYTRDSTGLEFLPKEKREAFEKRLRYIEDSLPHRMGGHADPVQNENHPDNEEMLLFQIASDRPMGWMWGDLGALYVTIFPKDLKGRHFKKVDAIIEGH